MRRKEKNANANPYLTLHIDEVAGRTKTCSTDRKIFVKYAPIPSFFRRAWRQDQLWLLYRSMGRCSFPTGRGWTNLRSGTCQRYAQHLHGMTVDCGRATSRGEPSARSRQRCDISGRCLTRWSMRWTRTTRTRRSSHSRCWVAEPKLINFISLFHCGA